MKKLTWIALALSLSLALSACGSAPAPAQSSASAAQDRVVEPAGFSQTLDDFTDGELSVSFHPADIGEADGRHTLTVTAYAYALYDAAEVTALTAGDTLVVDGTGIPVQSVTDSDGYLTVNGGEETGGVTLAAGDGGTYFIIGMDDAKDYQELGTLTLPLDDGCRITDDSDLSAPGRVLSVSALAALSGSEDHFVPYNTTVVVKDSVITAIHRFYMP